MTSSPTLDAVYCSRLGLATRAGNGAPFFASGRSHSLGGRGVGGLQKLAPQAVAGAASNLFRRGANLVVTEGARPFLLPRPGAAIFGQCKSRSGQQAGRALIAEATE